MSAKRLGVPFVFGPGVLISLGRGGAGGRSSFVEIPPDLLVSHSPFFWGGILFDTYRPSPSPCARRKVAGWSHTGTREAKAILWVVHFTAIGRY